MATTEKCAPPVAKYPDPDPFGMLPAYQELGLALLQRPDQVLSGMMALATEQASLSFRLTQALLEGKPAPAPAGDARFADSAWTKSPAHAFLAAGYTQLKQMLMELVRGAEGLDPHTRRKVEFFSEQTLDLLSPSNFALTNPQVLERAWESGGRSLFDGLHNLAADRARRATLPTQSDPNAFVVGRDLATTPGHVVARNHLAEILCYTPQTELVHQVPVVIISPWINKYYILDLQERSSFVRHLVTAGYTVFVVSWKNPDASMADTTFIDYLEHGVLFARDVAARVTGVEAPIALGYCIGGALLAMAQAYLIGAGKTPFAALALVAAMVDFEECGPIKVYIDERSIRHIERNMAERGFLTSDEMSSTFALLRARELVWSYYVDHYLLGKTPPAFDLLFWNADSTRMPRAMHSWYLRKLYLENVLRVPGALRVQDVPIDLGRIDQEVYLVAAEKDHIAPYPSVYRLHRYVRGPIRYVLTSSGHIAGIVNPPSAGKGYYHTAKPQCGWQAPADVEQWRAGAQQHKGSWWHDFVEWLAERTGPLVPPPQLSTAEHPTLGAAPGSYLLEK